MGSRTHCTIPLNKKMVLTAKNLTVYLGICGAITNNKIHKSSQKFTKVHKRVVITVNEKNLVICNNKIT
jgi:predicted nuclease of restriction endonuclease-like RecB superfamily